MRADSSSLQLQQISSYLLSMSAAAGENYTLLQIPGRAGKSALEHHVLHITSTYHKQTHMVRIKKGAHLGSESMKQ